jgi:hypothetical protein
MIDIAPTQFWVIMQKDTSGSPRGFHKTLDKIFYDEGSANYALNHLPNPDPWMVVPLVAISKKEFSDLTKSYEEQ